MYKAVFDRVVVTQNYHNTNVYDINCFINAFALFSFPRINLIDVIEHQCTGKPKFVYLTTLFL